MTMNEIDQAPVSSAVVKVTQLPIIEDQLRTLRGWVETQVSDVETLECTEENLSEVKALRSSLNTMFSELENRRKEVLQEVEDPITRFKATYKVCVSDIFKSADEILKRKIHLVESEMKWKCEKRLRDYFDELTKVHGIGFLTFEAVGITISMADARSKTQPPKKLRDQVEQFVLRVAQDLDMISTLDNASSVLSVYRQTLNVTSSISAVKDAEMIAAQVQQELSCRNAAKAQADEAKRNLEAFAPPTVDGAEPKQDDVLTVNFTITDTRDRLKLLKQFLDANGYQY